MPGFDDELSDVVVVEQIDQPDNVSPKGLFLPQQFSLHLLPSDLTSIDVSSL